MQTTKYLTEGRHDRVRSNTRADVNAEIDARTERYLRLYAKADKEEIAARLEELDREWDMERRLQANAAAVSLGGLLLGTFVNRKWFALPALVAGFLFNHAVHGWCPPVPLFRRFGVRTRKEIERERYALKLLRGDFDAFHSGESPNVRKVLELLDE